MANCLDLAIGDGSRAEEVLYMSAASFFVAPEISPLRQVRKALESWYINSRILSSPKHSIYGLFKYLHLVNFYGKCLPKIYRTLSVCVLEQYGT